MSRREVSLSACETPAARCASRLERALLLSKGSAAVDLAADGLSRLPPAPHIAYHAALILSNPILRSRTRPGAARLARRRRYSTASPTSKRATGHRPPPRCSQSPVRQQARASVGLLACLERCSSVHHPSCPEPTAAVRAHGPCDRLPHAFGEPAPWLTLNVRDRHPHPHPSPPS